MQTFAKSTKVKTAKLAEKGPPPNTALFSSIYGMPQFFSFGLRTCMCAFLRLAHLPSSIGSLSYTAVTLVAPPPCLPVSPSGGLLLPPHSPSHSFLPIPPLLHLSWFTFYIYRVFFPFLFRPKEEEEETAPASTTNFLSPRPNLEFASFVPLPDINEAREEESGGGSATP